MSLARNTLFSMLMALETDLRRLVVASRNGGPGLSGDEAEKAHGRWAADRDRGGADPAPEELLDYVDLSELLDVVFRGAESHAGALGMTVGNFRDWISPLRGLVPVRNRVCHARPLEPDDYTSTVGSIEQFADGAPTEASVAEYRTLRQRLASDPNYPLMLVIPSFWRRDLEAIPNNLPVPDYDDTGFIGRRNDREQLGRLLRGPLPVVTVTGEGGVGKTSLALQCLYDLVVDPARPFEQVIWITLKTAVLGANGVREIAGALKTPTEVLERAASFGGPIASDATFDSLVSEIVELLAHYRVLIAVDNLETIDRDALRPLFLELPAGAKILLTSRYGIGEFETLYGLTGMDPADAVRLLRTTARLLNADELYKRDDAAVRAMCEKLFYNPLAIRWFVESYTRGKSVPDLIERHKNLADVLNFCFRTLYDSLSEAHRNYLRILVAVGKPLSEVQLALLSGDLDVERIRVALRYLYSSNLLRRSPDEWGSGAGNLWNVSEFARAYIATRDKTVLSVRPGLVKNYRALIKGRDDAQGALRMNPFRTMAMVARTTDEGTIVALLWNALKAVRDGNAKAGLETVDRAKTLLPSYFEVWRVSGQVKAALGDAMGANADFDRAVELADGASDATLVHYSNFLVAQDDPYTAYDVLHESVAAADADARLIAAYAYVAMLVGEVTESLEQFGRVVPALDNLGGQERMIVVAQYCEALRRGSEVEMQRRLPGKAFGLLLRGLDAAITCKDAQLDRVFTEGVQATIERACRVLSRSCSEEDWELLDVRLVTLRSFMPLTGRQRVGIDALAANCSGIRALPSFETSFGSAAHVPDVMYGEVLTPRLGNDYTFIRGDDGVDYYLNRRHIDAQDWMDAGLPGRSRVRFVPGTPRDSGMSPPATSALVVRLDED